MRFSSAACELARWIIARLRPAPSPISRVGAVLVLRVNPRTPAKVFMRRLHWLVIEFPGKGEIELRIGERTLRIPDIELSAAFCKAAEQLVRQSDREAV